jgi:hypothetical protein
MIESEMLISKIEKEINDEQMRIKISLVEDVIKVKRLLAGWGFHAQLEVLTNPVAVFDELMEMEPEQLELDCAFLQAQASGYVRHLHKFD